MKQVTVASAREQAGNGPVLVDIREQHEWDAGHAEEATHMPLSRLSADMLDAETSYLVICRSGARSMQAVMALSQAGYDATDVAGGMLAWAQAGYPVTTADGRPGQVVSA